MVAVVNLFICIPFHIPLQRQIFPSGYGSCRERLFGPAPNPGNGGTPFHANSCEKDKVMWKSCDHVESPKTTKHYPPIISLHVTDLSSYMLVQNIHAFHDRVHWLLLVPVGYPWHESPVQCLPASGDCPEPHSTAALDRGPGDVPGSAPYGHAWDLPPWIPGRRWNGS